ncbi:ankyrin repeat and EF-hand domain-containing protein 1-like [Dendronephthya gigantea]|uniref:ankyrin repeat and EF-hand domain-containing protein 1-like n=1 Tax=Dendronephthya gigantea TaxID=151771 RepID=UPI001069BFE9|nr:ankyrin repeat and EF-hand domain-containing protein 1-like [Dendronephthya gigantea]
MPVAQTRLEQLQVLKLLQSVRAEDRTQIEKLATNGIPDLINYSEAENGDTAMHIAACKNNDNMISFLLDMGANPNVVNQQGQTPVVKAAEYGHIQCLQILADAGSDMTARDKEGKGILFYCLTSTKRHLTAMKIALEHGANVNNVSNDGEPLIVKAAEDGLEEFLEELLHAGGDPNSKHLKTSFSALHAAAASGSVECARSILEAGADGDALDGKNTHAVHLATEKGHYEVIRVLAAYGADLGKVNTEGNTALHIAAVKGYAQICKFLAQRGCPSGLKNKEGKLARILAKENEHKDVMKECKKAEKAEAKGRGSKPGTEPWAIRLYDWTLEHQDKIVDLFYKFDIEREDGSRSGKLSKDNLMTCLLTLSAPIDNELLKKVIDAHDPNKTDSIDYSVFLTGKKFVNKLYLVGAVKKKKKKGGGKKGRKKKGKTKVPLPICTAPEGPRTKNGGPPSQYIERCVLFTDESRFDRDNPPVHPIQDDSAWYLHSPDPTYVNLSDAVKFGDLESIKLAINNGTPVNQRDKYYKTPLMIACLYGKITIAHALLDMGADLKSRDNFFWTPLHHACHCGQLDIVKLLLERGADIDAKAINGGTPLLRAIESSKENVVSYLISMGAKVQLENKKGHTALDVAKAYADPRVLAVVQKRWDEIPPPVDKNKKGKKGRSTPKRLKSAGEKKTKTNTPVSVEGEKQDANDNNDLPPLLHKSSVLRAASALGIVGEQQRSIAFVPHKAWIPQATTEDLLRERETRRLRYGFEIDFPEYKPPFQKNVDIRVTELAKQDS